MPKENMCLSKKRILTENIFSRNHLFSTKELSQSLGMATYHELIDLSRDQLLKRITILKNLGFYYNDPVTPSLNANFSYLDAVKALCLVAGYPCLTEKVKHNGVFIEVLLQMSETERFMTLAAPMEGVQAIQPISLKRQLSTGEERVNSPPHKRPRLDYSSSEDGSTEYSYKPPLNLATDEDLIEMLRLRGRLSGELIISSQDALILSPTSEELELATQAANRVPIHASAVEQARIQVYSQRSNRSLVE